MGAATRRAGLSPLLCVAPTSRRPMCFVLLSTACPTSLASDQTKGGGRPGVQRTPRFGAREQRFDLTKIQLSSKLSPKDPKEFAKKFRDTASNISRGSTDRTGAGPPGGTSGTGFVALYHGYACSESTSASLRPRSIQGGSSRNYRMGSRGRSPAMGEP